MFFLFFFLHLLTHLGKTSETAAANLLTPPPPEERPHCSIGCGNALPLKALLPLKLEADATDVVPLLPLLLMAPPLRGDKERAGLACWGERAGRSGGREGIGGSIKNARGESFET